MVVKSVYLVMSLVVGFIICVTFSGSAYGTKIQPVYSLKNLGDDYKDVSGKEYKKLQIKCNTGPEPRYIHRIKGSELWCVNGDQRECSEDRIEAATKACLMSAPSAVAIETPSKAPTTAPSEAQLKADAERANLEEEFMANQQKKIELRERQLELRKRELELRQQQEQLN